MSAYFTVEELRAQYPDLSSVTKYPEAKLAVDAAYAEQRFEKAAGVAFVSRTVTETIIGNGSRSLFLTATVEVGAVTAVTIDGTELTADELADLVTRKYGVVERAATWLSGAEIVATYPHGYAEPPEPVKQAVMMLAAEKALPSTIPLRATSLNTDLGSYRISQADKTGRTGIPEVDAVIAQYGADKPAVG